MSGPRRAAARWGSPSPVDAGPPELPVPKGGAYMVAVYIILALLALFVLLEAVFFLIAFGGRTWADFTKHNFFFKPELRPYAGLILSGKRWCLETPHEDVTVRAGDGVRLHGRFYDVPDRRGIVIMMHGYRSMAENDFSCSSAYVHSQGLAMLLADQRAHGKSGGFCMTFGIREHQDLLTWIRYVAGRFPGEKIILEGLSMGASTVLMAAGEPLPPEVAGIICDCGYTSPRDIIRAVIRSRHLPVSVCYPMVRLAGRVLGGFDVESCSALEAGRRASLPALFIHGEADDFVPCQMGRDNFQAYAGPKRLCTVPGAGHGLSYVVDMEKCQKALLEFLESVLRKESL